MIKKNSQMISDTTGEIWLEMKTQKKINLLNSCTFLQRIANTPHNTGKQLKGKQF